MSKLPPNVNPIRDEVLTGLTFMEWVARRTKTLKDDKALALVRALFESEAVVRAANDLIAEFVRDSLAVPGKIPID